MYKLSDVRLFNVQIGNRVLETEVSDNFNIPVYSANVFEPFGKIDSFLKGFEDFSVDSVLWGIDGDWMVNYIEKGKPFYPTDHCGVLRVKTDEIEPKVLAMALEIVGETAGFKRSYRASIDRVKSLIITLPPLAEQRKIVAEVSSYEVEIAAAQAVMDLTTFRKQAILQKHGIILASPDVPSSNP